eukprot:3941779-Rhodomonas_salina.5
MLDDDAAAEHAMPEKSHGRMYASFLFANALLSWLCLRWDLVSACVSIGLRVENDSDADIGVGSDTGKQLDWPSESERLYSSSPINPSVWPNPSCLPTGRHAYRETLAVNCVVHKRLGPEDEPRVGTDAR